MGAYLFKIKILFTFIEAMLVVLVLNEVAFSSFFLVYLYDARDVNMHGLKEKKRTIFFLRTINNFRHENANKSSTVHAQRFGQSKPGSKHTVATGLVGFRLG